MRAGGREGCLWPRVGHVPEQVPSLRGEPAGGPDPPGGACVTQFNAALLVLRQAGVGVVAITDFTFSRSPLPPYGPGELERSPPEQGTLEGP